jgi:RNA polymerase sigma-70 factor, ECF subfamily
MSEAPVEGDDEVGRLVQAAANGDEAAAAALYRRYRPYLAILATPRIPREVQGRFDTEDVLQSVFLSAFAALKNYRYVDENRFKAWLREITVRKLTDRIRSHARLRRSAFDTLSESHLEGRATEKDDEQSPTVILARAERHAELIAGIQALPFEERQVLTMRCFERRTFADIGTELGLNEDAARRRYLGALEALGRRMH